MKITQIEKDGKIIFVDENNNEVEVELLKQENKEVENVATKIENNELQSQLEDYKKRYDLNEAEIKTLKESIELKEKENIEKINNVKNDLIKAEFIAQNGNISAYNTFLKLVDIQTKPEAINTHIKQLKQENPFLFNNNGVDTTNKASDDDLDLSSGSFYK